MIAALGTLASCSRIQTELDSLKARSRLDDGVHAFTAGDFFRAEMLFGEAVRLDPDLADARLYLANSTMMQYQPGSEYPENIAIANRALNGFKAVLEGDPGNVSALQSIASLYFNMKEMEDAKEWHAKVLAADPNTKESHYTIGVICWTQSFEPRLAFRAEIGMRPEDPGPIRTKGRLDRSQREALAELAAEVIPLIDEGLEALGRAIEIDPDYDDAMAYLNLLYREKADFAETYEASDDLLALADEWVQKALDTRKRKAAPNAATTTAGERERRASTDRHRERSATGWVALSTTIGCRQEQDIADYRDTMVEGEIETAREFAVTGVLAGECVLIEEGKEVRVVDHGMFTGLSQVRILGEARRYWVINAEFGH